MPSLPSNPGADGRNRPSLAAVLFEGLLVALAGAAVAFAANALSPRGLSLTRNFFPDDGPATPVVAAFTNSLASTSNTPSAWEELAARLQAKGLRLADYKEVAQLYADPRRLQGLIIFVDARDDSHYPAGHIPGAYQFDHYHPEKYIGAVLDAAQPAQQVVIYCHGGICEDSEFAATMLSQAIPKEKLLIYGGGITDWLAKGSPVELGERDSGRLQLPKSSQ